MSARMTAGPRRTILVMAGAVGLCTLAASSSELFAVTGAALFPPIARLAIPGGLDFGAVASGIAWAYGARESDLQRYGRRTTKQLIVASAVFNAAAVAHRFHVLPLEAVLVLALGMGLTFPVIAGQMMHLILMVQDGAPATSRAPQPQAPSRWRRVGVWVRARARRRPRPQRAHATTPSATPSLTKVAPQALTPSPRPQAPSPAAPQPPADPRARPRPVPPGTGDPEWERQLARVVAQKHAQGSGYGRRAVREDLDVSEERAKNLLAAAKDQLAERSPA